MMQQTRWRVRAGSVCLLAALLALAGCGGRESSDSDSASPAGSASSAEGASSAAAGNGAPGGSSSGSSSGGSAGTATGAGAVAALAQAASSVPRKIVYTAEVDLVVENLSTAQEKLARLVRASKGYISDTSIGGESGSKRSGTWKVRVPVENYEAFMAGATRLGELQSTHATSQDVTAEYYDVAARIANKQIEEQRLQHHLEVSTGKLSEILQVERELSRVRGEIEEMQGRIRVLANLSSLTTVTLTLNEIKNYVPPAPPSFGTQVTRQFAGSLDGLREAGKGLVLLVVALAPWLVVLGALGLIGRVAWRWGHRLRKRSERK